MFPYKQRTVDTRPTETCVNIPVDTHPWAVIVTETMSGRPMRDAGPLRISPAGAEDAHGPKELEELEGSHVVFRLREEKKSPVRLVITSQDCVTLFYAVFVQLFMHYLDSYFLTGSE